MNNKNKTYLELIEKVNKLETENKFLKDQQLLVQSNVDLLIWGTNTAIWEWDYATGMVKFSDKKAEMLGYEPGELNPDVFAFTAMIHPDDYGYTMDNMQNHLQGKTNIYEVEYRIKAKNGTWVWFYDKGKVTERTPEGKPIKIVGIVNDITEKKNAVLELTKAKEKAEESDNLKTAFLQNISHEIRTPLNAITGFSDIMSRLSERSDKLTEYSRIISTNSNRLIDKVTDVIEISQFYTSQANAKNNRFDFIQLINEIIKYYKPLAENKNIDLLTSIEPDVSDLHITTDRNKIFKIIRHLIDNAVKFTPKGSVSIDIVIADTKLEFTVTDTGIGISNHLQELIFKPFHQVEIGTSRNYGGTGLGLAIVRSYVRLLNGELTVQSDLNNGTKINVILPIQISTDFDVVKKTTKLIVGKLETVLIVEDEYDNYAYLFEILRDLCTTVLYASNGLHAVELCRNNDMIDIVLMDIKMPVMDGYTATQQIKSFRPGLPIIAQTAFAFDNDINSFSEYGFDDYICKPIKQESLITILRKFVKLQV